MVDKIGEEFLWFLMIAYKAIFPNGYKINKIKRYSVIFSKFSKIPKTKILIFPFNQIKKIL
jgi:hypothetical protein